MIVTKTIDAIRIETKCNKLSLNAYRNDEGEDGVLFIAWHTVDGIECIQTDFIQIPFKHIHSFLRDYSSVSAQDYVDSYVH